MQGDDLKKDYFGLYDPTSPGHMGYNWRQVVWVPSRQMVYGVHGNSGYLFRFDPRAERVEVLDRITSIPSQRAGMFDQFSYGYLGFTLGPDGRTIYYLTGGPVYVEGKRVAGKAKTAMGESKGIEDLHLITWDVPTGKYLDHGAIFFADGQRPAYVNSIAVGNDGTVYALSRITENGKTRTDLMSIPAALIRDRIKSGPGRRGMIPREHMSSSTEGESHEEFTRSTQLPGDFRGGRRRLGGDHDHHGRRGQAGPAGGQTRPS